MFSLGLGHPAQGYIIYNQVQTKNLLAGPQTSYKTTPPPSPAKLTRMQRAVTDTGGCTAGAMQAISAQYV